MIQKWEQGKHMVGEKTKPLVTVLIPSYNHERYVRESVLSIIEQTWESVQLIVVDDGSSDNSVKLLESLSEEYGFEFIAQENKGLTATLNDALAKSQGTYFCMLSSDDIAFPDKLEKQIAFMERRPDVGLCGGSAISIDENGVRCKKQEKLVYAELNFDDVFTLRKDGPSAPTMMARTEALRDVGGYDPEIRLEDMDMWLKLTHGEWKLACLDDVFSYYRVHENNTYKNLEFMLACLLESWGKYSDQPAWDEVRNKFIISTFLKAAKNNKKLAIKLIPKISVTAYDMKVLRGLMRLGFSW